jgi:hypothetical protein
MPTSYDDIRARVSVNLESRNAMRQPTNPMRGKRMGFENQQCHEARLGGRGARWHRLINIVDMTHLSPSHHQPTGSLSPSRSSPVAVHTSSHLPPQSDPFIDLSETLDDLRPED